MKPAGVHAATPAADPDADTGSVKEPVLMAK